MPITPFQREVLHLLYQNREPASHVAGGMAINRANSSPRFSADLDLFHETTDGVSQNATKDTAILLHGFDVEWTLHQPSLYRADARRGPDTLKLDWCQDSEFRFFPVQADSEFGYCLHLADLATNKALALVARSEVRDFIDILFLNETFLSLGAVAWAAAGKDAGFTPRSVLDFASRHMKFRAEHLAKESLARPTNLPEIKE